MSALGTTLGITGLKALTIEKAHEHNVIVYDAKHRREVGARTRKALKAGHVVKIGGRRIWLDSSAIFSNGPDMPYLFHSDGNRILKETLLKVKTPDSFSQRRVRTYWGKWE